MKILPAILCPLLLFLSCIGLAAEPSPKAEASWGDQGDGTFRNPILSADYSDLDAIRLGPDYYAISSTFQFSPGMVMLHTRDLVNWRILSLASQNEANDSK